MGNIVWYEHHGRKVAVDEDVKGTHRKVCLCFRCDKFKPEDRAANCKIANLNFATCVAFDLVLPVFECPEFVEK